MVAGGSATSIPATGTSNPLICGGFGGLTFVYHVFEWQKGVVTDLGALPGEDNCSAGGVINANGEIVGNSENGEIDPLTGINQSRPVRWKDGHITDLGSLGGNQGIGISINNQGQIVGGSLNTIADPFSIYELLLNSTNGTQTRAFLWQHGQMRDLGTLGGPDAIAILVNDRGQIAGMSYTNSTLSPNCFNAPDVFLTSDPFLWENGKMTDLGTLGGTCGYPLAIGISTATCDFTTGRRAFLWENGSMVDLNALILPGSGMQLTLAEAINDRGEIAINGTPAGCGIVEQCGHAVLLIPCDENHPGIEGCDYSLAEASATIGVSSTPAMPTPTSANQFPGFRSAANPMLRRFGRGLGPWNRGVGAQPQK